MKLSTINGDMCGLWNVSFHILESTSLKYSVAVFGFCFDLVHVGADVLCGFFVCCPGEGFLVYAGVCPLLMLVSWFGLTIGKYSRQKNISENFDKTAKL